jgi:hypothetical protein
MLGFFIRHTRTAWENYYSSRQNPTGSSIFVLNCLFNSFTSSNGGGALYCTSASYFLVESTSFFSCKTRDVWGGAIFFSSDSGQSVLYNVCGNDCCSTYTSGNSHSHFAHISVYNVASYKNYVNYSSIARCVSAHSRSYYTLYLVYAKILCPSVNMSMNKCAYHTFRCYPYSDSKSVTCSFTYSTFADIIASGYTTIYLNSDGANYEIKCCNILRNTQGSSGTQGTIYSAGNFIIKDSCIIGNNANYIFFQSHPSYTTTLSNCTIDRITIYGFLITQNTVATSFILGLNHMSTRNCHAQYDAVGTLSPAIKSPSSENQIYCYSGAGFFIQLPQESFLSLARVLTFNFIHLDIFSDPL